VVENGIPALLWTGWTPTDGPGAVASYGILQNSWAHRPPYAAMQPKQAATGRYQIVVGPWGHGIGLDDSIQLEWYDTWLRGQDTGMADTSTPMHLYEQQSDRWVNASTLPLTDDYTALHLGSDGALSTTAPQAPGSAELQWGDPTQAGTTVTFDASPLDQTQVVAGPVGATLWAKSSNRNINLIATLDDVAPDGTVQPITAGNIVGSLRAVDTKKSWTDRKGLTIRPAHPFLVDRYAAPASLQRYDIALDATLWSVAAGHHLRLVVSTQPPADKCASLIGALNIALPCLPSAPQRDTLPGGTYQLIWSKKAPSSINVPLVAPDALTTATSGTTATSKGLTEPLAW
jgi:predicted acyl esterase